MSITSIARDWGIGVNMVRIVSSDSLALVSAVGYITAQIPNTSALNNGLWQWLQGDLVAVYASDGDAIYQISNDFSSLVAVSGLNQLSAVNGLTALAGGGQTGATPLLAAINRVTTVASADDSVMLPAAQAGKYVVVINAGNSVLDVYPQLGESANDGVAVNSPVVQAVNKTNAYYCALAGQWSAIISA